MEGLFEMLMEQHRNEPSLSSVILDFLRDAQKKPKLWSDIVMEIDPEDPAAASDFLAGVLRAAEFDETFIPIHISAFMVGEDDDNWAVCEVMCDLNPH